MAFDDLLKAVSDVIPDFNRSALKDFVQENIDNSPSFPETVFREGFKLVPADLEVIGHTIMSPEETVRFELNNKPYARKSTGVRIPLTATHMRLVEYKIRFGNQFVYSRVYTPYMFEHMLHIGGKSSMVRKIILEKTISRMQEKDKDGVSVSPIRVNLKFNRRIAFPITSYLNGESYRRFIVTAGLFHGKISQKICETTIVHYMLAKFGFLQTLKRFGINKNDLLFVSGIDQDTDKFDYFAADKFTAKGNEEPTLFLKVNKALLAEDQSLKFVVNLMYVLRYALDLQSINNVYAEEGSIWKVILGNIVFGINPALKSYTNAETNLKSVDSFIDPITRKRFKDFGVPINDIYDLLVYIFLKIDEFMVNTQSQDIYNCRLDVGNILVESFGTRITWNLYYLAKRTNISKTDVEQALRLPSMMFKTTIGGRKDDTEHYIAPPEIVGDNYLFSGGLNKIRLGGKPDQRMHPSWLTAESIEAFVGKIIGKTGYLNPYIPTDPKTGAILKPDYAVAIDRLKAYLPK